MIKWIRELLNDGRALKCTIMLDVIRRNYVNNIALLFFTFFAFLWSLSFVLSYLIVMVMV